MKRIPFLCIQVVQMYISLQYTGFIVHQSMFRTEEPIAFYETFIFDNPVILTPPAIALESEHQPSVRSATSPPAASAARRRPSIRIIEGASINMPPPPPSPTALGPRFPLAGKPGVYLSAAVWRGDEMRRRADGRTTKCLNYA